MRDDDRRPCPTLSLGVQARIVDRDGCAAAQMLGELEVVLVVEPLGIGRDEHQRTERAAGGGQRHAHRRLHAELPQDLVMFRAERRCRQQLVADVAVEDRLARAHDAGCALQLVGLGGEQVL